MRISDWSSYVCSSDLWDAAVYEGHLHYRDGKGLLELPLPRLPGAHQADNAALAVAMIRHQSDVNVPPSALRAGLGWTEWPARMQRLAPGPLSDLLDRKSTRLNSSH